MKTKIKFKKKEEEKKERREEGESREGERQEDKFTVSEMSYKLTNPRKLRLAVPSSGHLE